MIRKITIFLLAILSASNIAFAQQDKTKEINKIKKDRNYLTVTGTSTSSEEEASNNAHIMLIAEIDAWLKENSKEDIEGYTAKAKKNISLIQTKRGSLYRAFAYVKKSDILPYYKDEIIITETPESETETTSNANSSVEFLPSNTIKEEVAEQSTPKQKMKVQENAIQESQKEIHETSSPKIQKQIASINNSSPQEGIKVSTEERSIKKLYTSASVKKYMTNLINNDRIGNYGSEITELPQTGVVYLIIFDYHGIARKYIRIDQGSATNLTTSSPENLKELSNDKTKGYSSIWFTFK